MSWYKPNWTIVRLNRKFDPDEIGPDKKCKDISFTYGENKEEAINYLIKDKAAKPKPGEGIENTTIDNVTRKGGVLVKDPTNTNEHHCLLSKVDATYLGSILRNEDEVPK